ncbi:MAG: hypothetical protein ACI9CD_001066, partial [Candidatus Deianiraeaceae bacterium]
MSINNIYKTIEKLQPSLTRMQTLCNGDTMQRIFQTQKSLQDNFGKYQIGALNIGLSSDILKQLQKPLLSKEITQSLARLTSLSDIMDKNTALGGISSNITKIFKNNESILGVGGITNMLKIPDFPMNKPFKSFDFKYTLGISSIINTQFKDLHKITQTFYGLQFSTTITSNNKNETHAQYNITITQAEYTEVRNERDYYKEKAFYWKEEFCRINKEKEQMQFLIQDHSQAFQTKLGIQNSKNAKKKE